MDMKQIAKIFIIISMVCGVCFIFPTVLGYFALKKIDNGEMDTTWAILTLLFVNTIAGILLLIDNNNSKSSSATDTINY